MFFDGAKGPLYPPTSYWAKLGRPAFPARRNETTLRSLLLLIAIAPTSFFAQAAKPASPSPSAKIGPSAVWQVPPDFVTKAHAVCDKSADPMSFGSCFLNQMAPAGAPAGAVNFSRALFQWTSGDVGIMTAFQKFGPVDAAQVFYPLRANTNYGLLLVNGNPPVIDVDNLDKLDRSAMEKDTMFQAIKQRYPKTDLWPADRSGAAPWPRVEPLPGGGTEFIVPYSLLEGCHACAHRGIARFGWDFDATGKFLRTTYIPTPPPPKLTRPKRQPGTPLPPANAAPSAPASTPPASPPSSPQ
jgi:hypothetical protein